MQGNIIKKKFISFAFEKTLRISLICKLVPVQSREYKCDLLSRGAFENNASVLSCHAAQIRLQNSSGETAETRFGFGYFDLIFIFFLFYLQTLRYLEA